MLMLQSFSYFPFRKKMLIFEWKCTFYFFQLCRFILFILQRSFQESCTTAPWTRIHGFVFSFLLTVTLSFQIQITRKWLVGGACLQLKLIHFIVYATDAFIPCAPIKSWVCVCVILFVCVCVCAWYKRRYSVTFSADYHAAWTSRCSPAEQQTWQKCIISQA